MQEDLSIVYALKKKKKTLSKLYRDALAHMDD